MNSVEKAACNVCDTVHGTSGEADSCCEHTYIVYECGNCGKTYEDSDYADECCLRAE